MGKCIRQGIQTREKSIRIIFKWNGERKFGTLNLQPTPKNIDYAETLRKKILARIEAGTFDYAEFFPKSKEAKQAPASTKKLFKDVADEFLKFKATSPNKKEIGLAPSTLKEYRRLIDAHMLEPLGNLPIDRVDFSAINDIMSNLNLGKESYNSVLSIFRGIFKYAIKADIVMIDPSRKFDFFSKDTPKPDPLTPDEVARVLRDMELHYHPQIAIYFDMAFRLGFRPSEGIDLRWENIDWQKRTILINSSKVRGIVRETTKTQKPRVVELDDHCMAQLHKLKQYTFMVGDRLFINPNTQLPYRSNEPLLQNFWHPTLKRLGIGMRDCRQTRHTSASMLLMADANQRWAAERLGHSEDVFKKVYSKWMPEVDNRRQLAKVSEIFEQPERQEKNAA